MTKGTGAVKITPAHDPNDFEVGERHNLERIVIMNDDATMNENAPGYEGLSREDAREKVLEDLEKLGLLTRGNITFLPTNFLYLLSFSLTATAVSPNKVSCLVVATSR